MPELTLTEVNFQIGVEKPETQFGIYGQWPKNWFELEPMLLWSAYVVPTIQQLQQHAAFRSHAQPCSCSLCDGRTKEVTPIFTAPAPAVPDPHR